jgi:4a-hydroxytetrahydrobiopterin dehydratase
MIKKNLLSRQCSPVTEKSPALSQSEISRNLNEVTGWSQKGVTIEKYYVFKDFKNAISFVNQVAEVAEKEDHHPDIGIYYNKIILTLWTHVVKGLTENDFILAAKIDAIS